MAGHLGDGLHSGNYVGFRTTERLRDEQTKQAGFPKIGYHVIGKRPGLLDALGPLGQRRSELPGLLHRVDPWVCHVDNLGPTEPAPPIQPP